MPLKFRSPIMMAGGIALIILVGGCRSSDPSRDISRAIEQSRSYNINVQLLEQLASHRVMLIGDEAHGQWQPRQTVIDFLDAWFLQVTADSAQAKMNRHLALVLEVDSLYLERARRYMDSGNPEDILDVGLLCSGVFTTADMEFHQRLADLLGRIRDYNASHEQAARIDLVLAPGEELINLGDWSFDRRAQYFLYDRDSLIASRIVRFETLHPDYNVIAFYGSAHLQRGIATKRADDDSAQGRFLASYLDDLLDNAPITVGQVTPDYWGPYRDLFVFGNADYMLPTASPNAKIHRILSGPMDYDFAVVHPKRYFWGISILKIPSTNIARIAITGMPNIMHTANDFYRSYWPAILTYLYAVSGESPHRLNIYDSTALEREYELWDKWLKQADQSVLRDMESLNLWERLIDSLSSAHGQVAGRFDTEIMSLLPDAPPLSMADGLPKPSDRAAELGRYLHSRQKDILIENLIGLFWVGDESERREARETLHKLTDTTFSSASGWAEWNRRRLNLK